MRELDIMRGPADRIRAMVRILAALLIVTTLAGNTAWALDVHFDDWNNHVTAEFGASDDGGGPVNDGPACPDHCGHSAAHLLGLHMDNFTIYASFPGRSEFTRSDRLTTRFPILPSEPPRA